MPKKRAKFVPIIVSMKRKQATLAKPSCSMTKDLATLMAEVQRLRAQVQKAEARRVLH